MSMDELQIGAGTPIGGSGARCDRCGRTLKNAHQAPDGHIYGPVCIHKLGLIAVSQSVGNRAVRQQEQEGDPEQLDFSL